MTAHSLLKRFELVTDTSANIPLLRRFIIDLAVRGKLIEKSNKAEPAPEILRRIADKRGLLSKSGKIKKQKSLLPIAEDDIPAVYSSHCIFERLANIAILEKGLTGIQSAQSGEYPLVVTAEARASCDHFDFEGPAAIIPMVSSTGHGHASLNRLHYQEGKFALGNILCAVFPISPDLISARFLYEYLTAFKEHLLVSKMIGTANVSLTIGKIGDVPIPIISPRVQQRVDELMALCDRLEVAQTERECRRDRLVASSLHHLNNGADPYAFREYARFYFNHLSRLTTRPDHIKQLRQTILNLAVRGKFVEQDYTAKHSFRASVDPRSLDTPYPLPVSWRWVVMEEIVKFVGGSQPPKSTFIYEEKAGYTRLVQIRDFKSDAHMTFVPVDKANRPFKKSDIMIGRYGPPVFQILRGLEGTYNVALMKAEPTSDALSKEYLFYLLQEIRIHDCVVAESERTAGQTGVRIPLLNSFLVALPPLAEQYRIVAKVDELMALCDQLETQLTTTQTESRHLLEAILHEALA